MKLFKNQGNALSSRAGRRRGHCFWSRAGGKGACGVAGAVVHWWGRERVGTRACLCARAGVGGAGHGGGALQSRAPRLGSAPHVSGIPGSGFWLVPAWAGPSARRCCGGGRSSVRAGACARTRARARAREPPVCGGGGGGAARLGLLFTSINSAERKKKGKKPEEERAHQANSREAGELEGRRQRACPRPALADPRPRSPDPPPALSTPLPRGGSSTARLASAVTFSEPEPPRRAGGGGELAAAAAGAAALRERGGAPARGGRRRQGEPLHVHLDSGFLPLRRLACDPEPWGRSCECVAPPRRRLGRPATSRAGPGLVFPLAARDLGLPPFFASFSPPASPPGLKMEADDADSPAPARLELPIRRALGRLLPALGHRAPPSAAPGGPAAPPSEKGKFPSQIKGKKSGSGEGSATSLWGSCFSPPRSRSGREWEKVSMCPPPARLRELFLRGAAPCLRNPSCHRRSCRAPGSGAAGAGWLCREEDRRTWDPGSFVWSQRAWLPHIPVLEGGGAFSLAVQTVLSPARLEDSVEAPLLGIANNTTSLPSGKLL
ncbi:PREDICTED: skin secretory protein xP2-like [Cercocebus atys]|uniref:skin secretory protein xP2-like n=1 Tax=Cercocebus atys TaxID=9531 RepID=UPI0005F524C7|nr:PREDICTED: skin secretory protein xP2-like [Cercocebus atys]